MDEQPEPTVYKILYNVQMKPVEFLGDSLDALQRFPRSARRNAGFELDKVQRGLDPDDWKPMKTVGAGVNEIRVRDAAGAFRVIYVARLADAIFVLHCFKKKSQRTPAGDIEVARGRYKQLIWRYR
jgi:phage-related protein